MTVRSFEPKVAIEVAARKGIVLLNHVGSSVRQDTGRDAQALANEFGMIVMAADRPGSGRWWPQPGLRAGQANRTMYAAEMSVIGGRLAVEAERQGLRRLLAVGRSAAATGVLALACTEQLPLTHLFAAEPAGWYQMAFQEGADRYKNYLQLQQQMRADYKQFPELVRPESTTVQGLAGLWRKATMLPYFLNDRHYNKWLWLSDTARHCATYVARNGTTIDTTIVFASHSMALPPGVDIDVEADYFRVLRPAGAPFEVRRTAEQTVHASFDSRSFMADQLRPIVARALT